MGNLNCVSTPSGDDYNKYIINTYAAPSKIKYTGLPPPPARKKKSNNSPMPRIQKSITRPRNGYNEFTSKQDDGVGIDDICDQELNEYTVRKESLSHHLMLTHLSRNISFQDVHYSPQYHY